MYKQAITMSLILVAGSAYAREPIAEDYRCLTTGGTNPIRLEFRMFSDPSSTWTGGYIKYCKSQAVIPLVLKTSKATDKPVGRPWDFDDTGVEVIGGQLTGDYEVSHQGAVINSFSYRNRKTGVKYSFMEDDSAMINDTCVWK